MKKFFEEGSVQLSKIHNLIRKLDQSADHTYNPVARNLGLSDYEFAYAVSLLYVHVKALEEAVALYGEEGCE